MNWYPLFRPKLRPWQIERLQLTIPDFRVCVAVDALKILPSE